MEELLPDIIINSKINERKFISRLHFIVNANKNLLNVSYEKNHIKDGEDSLVLSPKDKNGNRDLHLLVYNYKNSAQKVFIELLAEEWKIEPATYDLYSSEAKRIMLPILKNYNKKYKTRLRLRIQSKEDLKIKLPKLANDFFKGFTVGIYSNKLHPTNWKRFYWFIWHCHTRRVKLPYYALQRLLIENNFDYDTASKLSETYRIIREYLRTIKGY